MLKMMGHHTLKSRGKESHRWPRDELAATKREEREDKLVFEMLVAKNTFYVVFKNGLPPPTMRTRNTLRKFKVQISCEAELSAKTTHYIAHKWTKMQN